MFTVTVCEVTPDLTLARYEQKMSLNPFSSITLIEDLIIIPVTLSRSVGQAMNNIHNLTPPVTPLPLEDELFSSIFSELENTLNLVSPPAPLGNEDSTCKDNNDMKKRKIMHKDVERQRRQEMASLYTKLRSLLPPKNLKRKRSVSDDMDDATNYIKHLEKKIKEMNNKRDRLKGLTTNSSTSVTKRISTSYPKHVTVTQCCLGVEVTVLADPELPLPKVLKMLDEEGLNGISCVSTKINEMSFYTLHSEVNNVQDVDLLGLRQKLIDLVQ